MTVPTKVKISLVASATALVYSSLALSSASALTAKASTSTTTTPNATQQQHLATIISKGDQEINRRLTTLGTLSSKISSTTKLTAGDKSTLASEVSSTQSGLQSLKAQLDGDTTVTAAGTDAKSIYTDYRVYALVAPKVDLVKTADDEQLTAGKLTTLAAQLQTRITSDTASNKADLQSQLDDLTSKAASATSTANGIETGVINLQPTDYNGNHAVLTGDRDKLNTAHSDNQAAYTDAKNIVAALK